MKISNKALALVLALGFKAPIAAQEPAPRALSAEESFAEALQLYGQGHYAEATEKFLQLTSTNPDQPELFLNLGLAAFQGGKRGLAVGSWRKALNLNPTFPAAKQALEYATKTMQLPKSEDGLWLENLRRDVLSQVSLFQLLGLTAILLIAAGWPVVTYFGARRRALMEELPLPPIPTVGFGLGAILMVAFSFTGLKAVEFWIPRATAVQVTSVRSAPSDASSTLFELREGSDVILRQAKKGWTQIRYPGGMSGWVPTESLFQTSGMQIW